MGYGSSVIHPIQELTLDKIYKIKQATKRKLLNTAMESKKNTRETDWVIREPVPGSTASTDVEDFKYRNTSNIVNTTGAQHWEIDNASITADDLSSILVANEAVDDNAFIGIYGIFDLSPEMGELTAVGDTPTPPPVGSLVSAAFHRGGSRLAHWNCEHLYSYKNVIGIADEPVIFEQDEKIDFKLCFTEGSENKFVGLRAYICEPIGRYFSPNRYMMDAVSKDGIYGYTALDGTFVRHIPGGIDPVQELTVAEINRIKKLTMDTIVKMQLEDNVVRSPDDLVIREVQVGDETNATDFVDLDVQTAQTSGMQNWAQDDDDLTSGDLSSILASGEMVPDGKSIGIFGFFDKTAIPDAHLLSLETGSGMLFLSQIEHCYAYLGDVPMGISDMPTFYKQTDKIDPKVAFKDGSFDKFFGLRAYICEKWGDIVSLD